MTCYNKSLNQLHSTFLVAIAAMNLIAITHAAAQEPLDQHFWITDASDFYSEGRVRAMVKSDDTLYLGGDFLYVGPITGAGATFTTDTGEPSRPFPLIFGEFNTVYVYDAVPDGEGGWIIAGRFSEVAGQPIDNLAWLRANGEVEALPSPNDRVEAVALEGSTLYLGGRFTAVAGEQRNLVAAIDVSAPGGTLLPWNPDVTGGPLPLVYDLLSAGPDGPVVLAGWFTHVGGIEQPHLAFVESAVAGGSGALLTGPSADDRARSLSLLGTTLYVGGHFSQVGSISRGRLAAIDITTGQLLPWNPSATGFGIWAVAATPDAIYIGGNFNWIAGVQRNTPVALHPTTAALLAWDPGVYNHSIRVIAPSPEGVYLGGSFSRVNGITSGPLRNRLARVDAQTGELQDWPVHAGGVVMAISPSPDGAEVFIGGGFRSVGGLARRLAAAIDLKTGRLTDWDPSPNGSILDMRLTEDSVFVVGGFLAIGQPPVTRHRVAEVDLATGQPTAWTPPLGLGLGGAVEVTDDYVYVGGGGLVELDRATGAWTGRDMFTNGVRTLLFDEDANLLYVGGDFTVLAGTPRNRLGAIDIETGTATSWDPNLSGPNVRTLAPKGDVMYVGGTFDSIGGQDRLNAGAVLKSTGEVTPWNPTLSSGDGVHGTTLSLQAGEDVVYALGTFTKVAYVLHGRAAALDPDSGKLLADWHPQVSDNIHASILDGSRLYLGGSFDKVLGEVREGFATVTSLEPASPLGDLNGDGVVDGADLLILLSVWGPCNDCGEPVGCPADFNDDCVIDGHDLLFLLSSWG